MKVAIFDTHGFERAILEDENTALENPHQITFFEPRLTATTAPLAKGFRAISVFVNDRVDKEVISALKDSGIELIALRCAGYNNVDLAACKQSNIKVVRVPAYSPHAVAEHALCLILALNRKICRAYMRVREMNFSLDGLVGFDLFGKTVGVIGTGAIGSVFANIMRGLGCEVLAYDLSPNQELIQQQKANYVAIDEIYRKSDIISLHCPLTPQTRHIIDESSIAQMKHGVMIINTSRGALIDTKALITALKNEKIGGAGLDVYEEEQGVFFEDLSEYVLQDDLLARLLTFPNVLITAHQGFLTKEALHNIANSTMLNFSNLEARKPLLNELTVEIL